MLICIVALTFLTSRKESWTDWRFYSTLMGLAALPTHSVATIYSRTGDWYGYGCVAGLVGLVGWALLKRTETRVSSTGKIG